jgi:hypothetical protein
MTAGEAAAETLEAALRASGGNYDNTRCHAVRQVEQGAADTHLVKRLWRQARTPSEFDRPGFLDRATFRAQCGDGHMPKQPAAHKRWLLPRRWRVFQLVSGLASSLLLHKPCVLHAPTWLCILGLAPCAALRLVPEEQPENPLPSPVTSPVSKPPSPPLPNLR